MLSARLLDKNPGSVPSCSSHQAIRKADLSVKTLSTLIWGSTLLLAAFGSAGWSARTARISRITVADTCSCCRH
jgi:hypothetical protein